MAGPWVITLKHDSAADREPANPRMRNSPTVKMTVVTPNADSFMASQSQIQGKMHNAQ